ncbi:RNA polymerase sigma factor [Draconibacterium sediminis]|uniref:HTH luxR-type domain-containing protein n=1 Tax=Draconibacterium sediminis TaxID=1544798 RepID=A0A0D8JEP6_9BACT|nr:sigma-70 family RNA polymerase sigma factor [Draconibacterium sediminis]KJF45367.1 hypothetical protein LH29_08335 [Draconibacterium sediminis]
MKGIDSNTDRLLISGLKHGNHTCFEKLYELYATQLFNFSYKLLKSKDAAEDIVQETFVKIWHKRSDIKIKGSFRSLLITIALNDIRASFNKIAKENGLKNDLLYHLSANSEKYSAEDDYERLLTILENIVSSLPEKRRIIFTKKKLEGKKARDIAAELNVSEKTVEYHVTQAMKFLKSEFKVQGISGAILLFILTKFHNRQSL